MNRFGIDRHEPANLLFGILLFVICPLCSQALENNNTAIFKGYSSYA